MRIRFMATLYSLTLLEFKCLKRAIIMICFVSYSLTAQASVNCHLLWGKATIKNDTFCDLQSLSDGQPILVQALKGINKNLNKENLSIELKAFNVNSLNGLQVRFLKDGNIMFQYDLPLFKDSHFNLLQDNLVSTLTFPYSQLKKITDKTNLTSIDEVQIYIDIKKSQTFKLNILSLDWKKKKALEGVVSISFDDGYASQFKAAQIMKSIDIAGIAYLIPDAIEKKNYLNKEQISQLLKWNWDLSSHHQTPIIDFKKQEKNQEFLKVTQSIKKISQNDSYKDFAYPLGLYDSESFSILKKYFRSSRLASGGFETLPPADLYRLRAINVTPQITAQQLSQMAQDAIKNGDWAIFMFHYIDEPDKNDLNYSSKEFEKFMTTLKKYKKNIMTMTQLFKLKKL